MSKRLLILILFLFACIAILVAAVIVEGFTEWVSLNVINPLGAAGGGLLNGIASSPFWHQWTGYFTIFVSGFILAVFFTAIALPIIKRTVPKPTIPLQTQPTTVDPQPIPKKPAPTPIKATPPPTKVEPVKEPET